MTVVIESSKIHEIQAFIENNSRESPRVILENLESNYPIIPAATIWSIVNQRLRKRCAISGGKLSNEHISQSIYQQYKQRVAATHKTGKRRRAVLPGLAEEAGYYPWMIFRAVTTEFVRERDGTGRPPSKKIIQSMLRNPSLINDVQLQLESIHCAMQDDLQGLIKDNIRNLVGRDHELLLAAMLREQEIAFIDEETQRKQGQDVTPDFRLLVPISVNSQPVCWIDSKAMFGESENHKSYLDNQLLSYWNRFGPGLVIYWFGYEAGIERFAPEVQVANQLPTFTHFNP